MVCIYLRVFRAGQLNPSSAPFQHIQCCCHAQFLGLTALEKRRTVHTGNNINFSGKGANIAQPAARQYGNPGPKDTAADYLALYSSLNFFLSRHHPYQQFIGQGISY